MREIKFRAWDKKNKKNYDGNLNLTEREEIDGNERFILEQYTGLKDKNGKEIYEGDIVACMEAWSKEYAEKVAVSWDYKLSGFAPFIYPVYKDNVFEVIGNIHENPELLEEA